MRARVVVTGGAGFIGSNLCRALLEKGFSVLAIDDLSAGTQENIPEGVEFYRADVTSPDLFSRLVGAETVFHLAAKNCLADCAANPVETARVNVAGTANVVAACVKAGVRHVVYADTSAEYEGIEEFPSRVDRVRPLSVYACSKRGGALAAEALTSLHGIRLTTVRYFNVYGQAQDWRRVVPPVMSAFTRKLLAGERPVIYGSGMKSRDFIHVDDVNSFHLMLMEMPELRGGTYNLGTGKDHTILDVFQRIQRAVGSKLEPTFEPDLPAEAERTLADTSETVMAGWRPRVGLDEGIKRFVEDTRGKLSMSSPRREYSLVSGAVTGAEANARD